MDYFFLAVAAVSPLILIIWGKKFLGSQTHPSAIFILAWFLCVILLSMANLVPDKGGVIAFLWVGICYGSVTLVRKIKMSSNVAATDSKSESNKKDLGN